MTQTQTEAAESAQPQSQGRALVIMNPKAGSCTPEQVRAVLDESFGAHGWTYTLYETSPDDDLRDQVRRAREEGCDLVVAGGGDGTVSLVANELAGSAIPLGVLPLGTANVLARELGIPTDLGQAVALLVGPHREREMDLMRVNGRHFILQIGIGLDSLMIKDTDREAKRRFGRLAYLATLVGKLVGYQSQRFTIAADGKRMRPRAWQALIANAGTLGVKPLRWGPDISPTDGELDLCLFNVRQPADYARLLWRLLSGRYQPAPNITYVRIHNQIAITTDRPLPVQADGEIIGETPVQVAVVPRGIRIIVPQAEPESRPTPLLSLGAREDQAGAGGAACAVHPAVEQASAALSEAVAAIRTPKQADKVLDELERAAADQTQEQVARQAPAPDAQAAAAKLEQVAAESPPEQKPQRVIATAAKQIARAEDEDRELLAQAVQRAISPEAVAAGPPATAEERQLLQDALLRRLKPLSYADTAVFLTINHLPHTELLNTLMYALTTAMNRGDGWVVGLLLAAAQDHRRGRRALLDVLPALWLATATVEFPIKHFFRRKRPFISLVRAIVVGRKPGHYSFPSGHSAAAFAGAWLIGRHYPRLRPLLFLVAGLVGFSRVYLGAHYPGDVLSGAASGVALAALYRRLLEELGEALD